MGEVTVATSHLTSIRVYSDGGFVVLEEHDGQSVTFDDRWTEDIIAAIRHVSQAPRKESP